jgi:hypothetical protein
MKAHEKHTENVLFYIVTIAAFVAVVGFVIVPIAKNAIGTVDTICAVLTHATDAAAQSTR